MDGMSTGDVVVIALFAVQVVDVQRDHVGHAMGPGRYFDAISWVGSLPWRCYVWRVLSGHAPGPYPTVVVRRRASRKTVVYATWATPYEPRRRLARRHLPPPPSWYRYLPSDRGTLLSSIRLAMSCRRASALDDWRPT